MSYLCSHTNYLHITNTLVWYLTLLVLFFYTYLPCQSLNFVDSKFVQSYYCSWTLTVHKKVNLGTAQCMQKLGMSTILTSEKKSCLYLFLVYTLFSYLWFDKDFISNSLGNVPAAFFSSWQTINLIFFTAATSDRFATISFLTTLRCFTSVLVYGCLPI